MSDLGAGLTGLILVVLLIGLSAAESALNGISTSRAEALEEDGVKRADRLVAGLANRRRLLAPILVLSLGSQLSLGAIVAVVVERRWGVAWVPLGILILLLSMFVIAESVPKSWALWNIDRVAPAAASASRLFMAIHPLRWLVEGLGWLGSQVLKRTTFSSRAFASEEEIVAITDAAVAADILDVDEGAIIQSIVDFGDTIVREVMVPRPDVLAASADTTVDDAIALMVERGVSRMPLFGDDIDDVRGIVHIKDLFARMQRGRGSHFVSIAQRKPMFVPETKRAADLLRELKGIRNTMVVVIDEYGGMAGIVTMEDLIEEFLGEIVDEFDAEEAPLLEPLRGGEWRIHGRIPIDEFNELTEAELPDDDWDTVGGLIFDALGHVPEVGEQIVESGLLLEVEAVEGRRITRVRVARALEMHVDEETRELARNE
ncbi:MAG: hemolysin family protein [Acidimicrobiia bacterium]|nr:hemolysin family protein [Acidimicrobiia bacterium]